MLQIKKIFNDILGKQSNDGQSRRPNVLCQKKCRINKIISNCFHGELNLRTCFFSNSCHLLHII